MHSLLSISGLSSFCRFKAQPSTNVFIVIQSRVGVDNPGADAHHMLNILGIVTNHAIVIAFSSHKLAINRLTVLTALITNEAIK
jgi:hypothetical protein